MFSNKSYRNVIFTMHGEYNVTLETGGTRISSWIILNGHFDNLDYIAQSFSLVLYVFEHIDNQSFYSQNEMFRKIAVAKYRFRVVRSLWNLIGVWCSPWNFKHHMYRLRDFTKDSRMSYRLVNRDTEYPIKYNSQNALYPWDYGAMRISNTITLTS